MINAIARPHLLYNKLKLHKIECEVFKTSDVHKFELQPIIGLFQYEDFVKKRKRAISPMRRPVAGASNLPAERLYQRRLRDLTPALWFEVPHLVCVLLSLAQIQWKLRKRTTKAFFARLLVTNVSDTAHAHVFQADILSKLLHVLDNPNEDMDNLVWPAIQHVQVPFEPHTSFSERITGQLLAGLKTRADEQMPRGEKRKGDELDTGGQTKSVKAWDATIQAGAVLLANG